MSLSPLLLRLTRPFRKPLLPFMSQDEITALELLFGTFGKPLRVLEWGSGGSTLHFSRRLPSGSRWLSIEHHRAWLERVQDELKRQGIDCVELKHVAANNPDAPLVGDGDDETFHDYIHYPSSRGEQFDCIIVDGRARVSCMREAWKLLPEDGVFVLHDAQRKLYVPGRPPNCSRVVIRDPRKQVDDGDIELHFYTKQLATAQQLESLLRGRLSAPIVVTID